MRNINHHKSAARMKFNNLVSNSISLSQFLGWVTNEKLALSINVRVLVYLVHYLEWSTGNNDLGRYDLDISVGGTVDAMNKKLTNI